MRDRACRQLRAFARGGTILFALAMIGGCAMQRADPAVMDSLAEMEIRIRLLQSELSDVRQAIAEGEAQRDQGPGTDGLLQTRLDDLQHRIDTLPEQLADFCPGPQTVALNDQCNPEVQRVVVSGDKLVVGEVERVWVEPPGAFLVARIDASAEHSFIAAEDVVEFERDGNKWIRFGVTVEEETVSMERPLKRFVRARNDRRPIVDLRVHLGDVRETVEFAVGDLPHGEPVVLGRNFLTDVALVDVARKNVQPAFKAPTN